MSKDQNEQWTISPDGTWNGLQLQSPVKTPSIGSHEYLVQMKAVSLNYRDVAMVLSKYPQDIRSGVVACSDGVGEIIKVGGDTKRFKEGDSVCTVFNPAHQSGPITKEIMKNSLGNLADGVLRRYAVFNDDALVKAPSPMTNAEAATLTCAASTAYNCLFGFPDKKLATGEWILTQGTGGVSLFAVQMALAAGANVIGTTSSADKGEKLRELGVKHIINYKTDSEWGESAKKLTLNGEGVHHVVEVGGDSTMSQSLKAVRPEGLVSLVGFLGGGDDNDKPKFSEVLSARAIVRGMSVGPRELLDQCSDFMARHEIHPIVDSKQFKFEEALEAYKYVSSGGQFGKVVINI